MADFSQFPGIEDASVACSGTIVKSQEELEDQARFQKNQPNPVFYEVLAFHKRPIRFHSFVVLGKDGAVALKEGDSTVELKSETSLNTDAADLRVFVRILADDGPGEYEQLCVAGDYASTLVFADPRDDARGRFADRLVVVGSFSALTYLVLKTEGEGDPPRRWDPAKHTVYYGNNILDLNKHIIAPDSLNDSVFPEAAEAEPGAAKPRESKTPTHKTLNDLTNYMTINEHYEKVQNLKKNLSHLANDVKSKKHLEDTMTLLSAFVRNDLLFKDFVGYETVEPLMKELLASVVYDGENQHFGLLKLLAHDAKVARYLLNQSQFTKALAALHSERTAVEKRGCLLSMLAVVLTHPHAIAKFVANDHGERAFSYDHFVAHASHSAVLANAFGNQLADLGANLGLYIVLAQTESLYHKLSKNKMELSRSFSEDLQKLSLSVKCALDRIRAPDAGGHDAGANAAGPARHFVVACLRDTHFVNALCLLLKMLLFQLSEFPLLAVDARAVVEGPLEFVKTFGEFFDFHECAELLQQVAERVAASAEPVAATLRPGFPYAASPALEFFGRVRRECTDVLLYHRVLHRLSATVSQGSFDTTLAELCALSREFEHFYQVFCAFLEKPQIANFILKALNSYMVLMRDDAPPALVNKINRNVSLLLNLVCRAMLHATYDAMNNVGRPLAEFLEMHLPKLEASKQLDAKLASETLHTLRNVLEFMEPSESGRRDTIADISEFLKSVFERVGLKVGGHAPKDPSKPDDHPLERLATTYCSHGDAPMVDIRPSDGGSYERAKHLGVQPESYGHYREAGLAVVPEDRPPREVNFALAQLAGMAQRAANRELFRQFVERDRCKALLYLAMHVLAAMANDLRTSVDAKLDAFAGLVGYAWMENAEACQQVLAKVMYLLHMGLRHVSMDGLKVEFAEACSGRTGEVQDANLLYRNDEMLRCLALTAAALVSRNRTGDGNACLNALANLTHYWFRRFRRARDYLLNTLMETCTLLPRMYEGCAFLIVACRPTSSLKATISFTGADEEEGDKDGDKKEEAPSEQPASQETFWLNGKEYRLLDKEEPPKNEAAMAVLERRGGLNRRTLVEFMCVVAARCHAGDPGALTASAALAYVMVTNAAPLGDFLAITSKLGAGDANFDLRLVAFLSNVVLCHNTDRARVTEAMLVVNCRLLQYAAKVIKGNEVPAHAYPVLFEGMLNGFTCFNRTWDRDHAYVVESRTFSRYPEYLCSAVRWLLRALNGDTPAQKAREGPAGAEPMPQDVVTLGLHALVAALQHPFVPLTVMYNLNYAHDFAKALKSHVRGAPKTPTRSSDRDNIPVKLTKDFRSNRLVEELVRRAAEPAQLSDAALFGLAYNLHLLAEAFEAIHRTGRDQDAFIFYMTQGAPDEEQPVLDRDGLFGSLLGALEALAAHARERNTRHVVALLLMTKAALEDLKKELLNADPTPPKTVPVSALCARHAAEPKLFLFGGGPESQARAFLATAASYRAWPQWAQFCPPVVLKLDYTEDAAGLPFSGLARPCEAGRAKPEAEPAVTPPASGAPPEQQKRTVPVEEWKEFDAQLAASGLDIVSLVNNPGALLDPETRKSFVNAVIRNSAMFTHMIRLGVNVLQ